MSRLEKPMREKDRNSNNKSNHQNPSFSTSLLDEIYRSIDGGGDSRFYGDHYSMLKQQNKRKDGKQRTQEEENWVVEKMRERGLEHISRRRFTAEFDRKTTFYRRRDNDRDEVLFFTSTSSSSDSSSSGFSSSDTELVYGRRSRQPFCFAPPQQPKPVRTGGSSVRMEKTDKKQSKKQSALFKENREIRYSADFTTDYAPRQEENLIKSKTRAMKIYNNLKKVKQPISPGGRLASFINSLFTHATANAKKPSSQDFSTVSEHVSTCSSASSFSRSCLSKHSPSTREKLRNGVKRNVSFYPVSVVVGEDSRPCGHKGLEEEVSDKGSASSRVSVAVPSAWRVRKSPTREIRVETTEKSRRVEEMAREILRDYGKKDVIMRKVRDGFDDDDEDDAMSCSSSDLFELDLIGNGRYKEELPVYETTHVQTNLAIANGLIM